MIDPPLIDPNDRGFTLGDGLFETLLAVDGRLRDADAHLTRLAAGCVALGLPALDHAAAAQALGEAGAASGRWAVRLTLTAGQGGRGLDRPPAPQPVMIATAGPSPAPAGPARLITATARRNEGSPASRLKTLSYIDNVLARAQARAAGADEAVMLNNRGEVACATAANIFWLAEGVLFTPALSCGVLGGIVRARLIAAAGRLGVTVREAVAGPDALASAEALMLTNSLIGLRPVASLDGRAFPGGRLVAALTVALDA